MSYVFLVPKKFDSWSKNVISGHFSVHFRWNSRRKIFLNIFIEPKDSSLNFRGSLLSYFWPIMLISAVISILEDFGSLLPARTVTVKLILITRKITKVLFDHKNGKNYRIFSSETLDWGFRGFLKQWNVSLFHDFDQEYFTSGH